MCCEDFSTLRVGLEMWLVCHWLEAVDLFPILTDDTLMICFENYQ